MPFRLKHLKVIKSKEIQEGKKESKSQEELSDIKKQ